MKKLFLITTGFPFPAKSMETYLETETSYYDAFDEVNILSLGVRKKVISQQRKVQHKNIHIYPIIFASKIIYILNGIAVFFDRNFYHEIIALIKGGKITIGKLIHLVVYISRSHIDASRIKKNIGLNENEKIKDATIYVYRFEYQPYVALLIKKYFDSPKIVARAHRYDLYEEENKNKYIPMREYLLKNLDHVYLISNDGLNYLSHKYKKYRNKMSVSRLGTVNQLEPVYQRGRQFCIVSCSNMVAVKRVDLIVHALSLITDVSIEWIHYGAGEQFEIIKDLATKKLKHNVRISLKGRVQNQEILKDYMTNSIDVFINLSESEGIPVSIMEALSFGFPCIATDVGGTKEIVIDGFNGILLKKDCSAHDVSNAIRTFITMSDVVYTQYRVNSRKYWKEHYDANTNYKKFVSELINE